VAVVAQPAQVRAVASSSQRDRDDVVNLLRSLSAGAEALYT
jgi:hypothetical protein